MSGPEQQSRLKPNGSYEGSEVLVESGIKAGSPELSARQPVRRLPAVSPNTLSSQTTGHSTLVPNDGVVAVSDQTNKACKINMACTASALFLPGKIEGYTVLKLIDSRCTLNFLSRRVF